MSMTYKAVLSYHDCPKDEGVLFYNKERKKCAADYLARELGGIVGI